MTILVDTGVLYVDHDIDASRHDAASTALDVIYDGEFGQPYVSDYIYDEAVTLTLRWSGSFEPAKQLGEKLRASGRIRKRTRCSAFRRRCSPIPSISSSDMMIKR